MIQAVVRNHLGSQNQDRIFSIPNQPNFSKYSTKNLNFTQTLMVGAGILAVGLGIAGILAGRHIIPLRAGVEGVFIGLGAGLTALGVTSVVGSGFFKSTLKELKIVSFNVGTFRDWSELRAKEELEKAGNSNCTLEEVKAKVIELKQLNAQFEQQVRKNQKHRVDDQLGRLLDQFSPDIICLQEYFDGRSHEAIKEALLSRGYAIAGGQVLAIAYKAKNFDPILAGKAFNKLPTSPDQPPLEAYPSLFVDLKHQESGTVVRAWSDHVKGYCAVEQKQHTQQRRQHGAAKTDLPGHYPDRQAYWESMKAKGSTLGDRTLDKSLGKVQRTQEKPHIIVGGLDANATSKHSSDDKNRRSHPKRLHLITEVYNYRTDRKSKAATIRDAKDRVPRKYDYTVFKLNPGASNAGIISGWIEDILTDANREELLDPKNAPMSDHLPVVSRITFKTKTYSLPFFG